MIKWIDTTEECLGKYRKKGDAEALAEAETKRTGKKHHAFLTHYHCPYSCVNKMHWTILVSKKMDKEPQYKIMKIEEFEDSCFYRIACDCGTPEHDLEVEVEFDKHGVLWLFLSGQHTVADWWNHLGWFGQMWKRIKLTFRLLFTGWFETNGEFLVLKEEHIDSIISFLQSIKQKKIQMVKKDESNREK